jgi:hypothetical protein
MTKTFIKPYIPYYTPNGFLPICGGEIMLKSVSDDTYGSLVSRVLELDYIIGPRLYFDVKEDINDTHNSVEGKCVCAGNTKFTCRDYNISVLADFLHRLDEYVSQEQITDSSNMYVSFIKNLKGTNYVSIDRAGKKFINLEKAGENLFNEIWSIGHNDKAWGIGNNNGARGIGHKYVPTDVELPLSELSSQGDKIDLAMGDNFEYEFANNNLRNHLKTDPELGNKSANMIIKKQKMPSTSVQNTYSSLGLTREYL